MRFASLGSGSRGNATLVEHGSSRVLFDCGFPAAQAERRLGCLGRRAGELTAIVVTHEHGDHLRGVARLSRRHRLPVWATAGTAVFLRQPVHLLHRFNALEGFVVGDLEVHPFAVPHDAREPTQFVIGDGARCLGILTDTGMATAHIARMLTGCDALILECNHDPGLLAAGPYPPALQARVGGSHGHLSNGQAADLLARLDRSRLRHLVAAHLSERNNRPEYARAALAAVLGCALGWIAVADQKDGLDWRDLS